MTVLDHIRNAIQRPEKPVGNPAELSRLRQQAYQRLFEEAPVRVLPHADFGKPENMGGAIDVLVYPMTFQDGPEKSEFFAVVTDGLSNYPMQDHQSGTFIRREIVQYMREATPENLMFLHNAAWMPLAARFTLDFFETMGPFPGTWPGAAVMPPLVESDAAFSLDLEGDEMKLLWLVPLTEKEVEYKLANGFDALLDRMEEVQLPWIFDAAHRPPLV